jgi:hypothetical protein
MNMEMIAGWSFVAFVFIAILAGLTAGYMEYTSDVNYGNFKAYVTLTMLILGVVVGLVSITGKEAMPFLIATIALIVATSSNVWAPLGTIHELLYYWATDITRFIVAFAAPAAVLNSVKAVLVLTKDK